MIGIKKEIRERILRKKYEDIFLIKFRCIRNKENNVASRKNLSIRSFECIFIRLIKINFVYILGFLNVKFSRKINLIIITNKQT